MAISIGVLPLGVETCCNDPEHPCPPKKPIPGNLVSPKLPPKAPVIPDFAAFVPANPISFSGALPAPCG
jgi:hypothetical protein